MLVNNVKWKLREAEAFFSQYFQTVATSRLVNALTHPTEFAELELALLEYDADRNNLKIAEERLSSAILGLLLSDLNRHYDVSKILVGLINAHLLSQDVVGAFGLADKTDTYLTNSVPPNSVLHAQYKMLKALLLSYTNLHAQTAAAFLELEPLVSALEINGYNKVYWQSNINSLASAALVLAGKFDDATATHAKHPMQKHRETILNAGKFESYTEFFFAVSDVFITAAANGKPDARWKPLFEHGGGYRNLK